MAYLPCDRCGSSDAVEPYEDGDKCFSCGWKDRKNVRLKLEPTQVRQRNLKEVKLTTITLPWLNWITSKGLTKGTVNHFNIQYDELSNSIVYPLFIGTKLVGYQLRDKSKKIKTVKYVDPTDPFLFTAIHNNLQTVVIVEDPISAMRVWQDGQINVIALLGTTLSTVNRLEILDNYKKILVWMDGDIAGYESAKKIVNDCQPFSETRLIFTQKDPKDHTSDEIRFILENML